MKVILLGVLKAIGRWFWALVKETSEREVRAEQVAEDVKDALREADKDEALRIERTAAAVPRSMPGPAPPDTPAARIETRRGRRPSSD